MTRGGAKIGIYGLHLHISDTINFPDDFNDGFVLLSLIKQLISILEQYPDDGQILKVRLCGTLRGRQPYYFTQFHLVI